MNDYEPSSSSLSFTIETFDDPETGQLTQYGRFSRHWQDEEALDVLIDKLEAGQLSHKQALMQARKLEATTPYNLEIQNFIANRLWALGLQDEATEVYERAYKQALAHIPKGFKGQITWGEVDMVGCLSFRVVGRGSGLAGVGGIDAAVVGHIAA